MSFRNRALAGAALVGALALTLAACSSGETEPSVPTDTVIDRFGEITGTVGPNGEQPTPGVDVTLTQEQEEQLRGGDYRAGILWHELSAWSLAIQAGIEDQFADLGITVVATAGAKFDTATQANQIESTLALKPDVILGQAVDPSTGATAYQPAVDAGVKLIFADQAPDGYTYGDQYQAILTDDLFQIGQRAARQLGESMNGEGTVAVLYYDADFHVTNFRDASFLQTLATEYPDMKVVAKKGFSDPNKAEEIATALLAKFPNLGAVYTSWAVPAQGVLAALNAAGNETTKIVTIDLDDTIAADLASPNGHTVGIVADKAYEYGRTMARAAGLAVLGELGPEFGISDAVTVTSDSLVEGYAAWNEDVPESVLAAKG